MPSNTYDSDSDPTQLFDLGWNMVAFVPLADSMQVINFPGYSSPARTTILNVDLSRWGSESGLSLIIGGEGPTLSNFAMIDAHNLFIHPKEMTEA